MRNALISAAAFLTLGVGAANTALADDPCAGYGVACNTQECAVCWANEGGGIDCTAASYIEVSQTLPGCVPPLPSTAEVGELAIPEILRLPELAGTGDRTVLPLPPQNPDPRPQRDPLPTLGQ